MAKQAGDYVLFGCKGWGSVLVEAMLVSAGLPYRLEPVDMSKPAEVEARLRPVNPLGQVPTLILPDGTVMTESAAIALYLDGLVPSSGLAPPVGDPARPAFLRWLAYMVGAIYPTFTYGDDPSRWVDDEAARRQLRASTDRHRERLWRQVEGEIRPAPWFLGGRFSVLDIYVGAMTHWRPRRDWFAAHCPRLHALALQVDAHPALQPVWQRNFDP
jgi:GST-like protein